jgi:hypothetical protein
MDERQRARFSYSLGHNLKNIVALFGGNYISNGEMANLCQTGQMLWRFRNHPEYESYEGSQGARLYRLLGIDKSDSELEELIELSKKADPLKGSGTFEMNAKRLISQKNPGIMTDLLYSFRKKSATIPLGREEEDTWEYFLFPEQELVGKKGHHFPKSESDDRVHQLYIGATYLPRFEEKEDLILDDWLFAPNPPVDKRAREQLSRHFESSCFTTLTNPVQKALEFVKQYNPQAYERFNRAVS